MVMFNKMEVQVSGCVFSSLFLELANSQGDVEGFLLGKIDDRTTRTVSDSQDVNVVHTRILAVQETIVCPGLFSFYDGVGHIHMEKLDRILGSNKQEVLGWFKFRRSTRLGVSMRERAIHNSLLEQLSITDSRRFMFSVFTSHVFGNRATHPFRYSAHFLAKHKTRMFHRFPIKIINLGNTAQTEYKFDVAATTSTSKQYRNVVGSYSDEFLDNVGQLQQVKHARSMYKNMLMKLKGLKEAVHKSETKLTDLSESVNMLRHELEMAMREKRLKPEVPEVNLIELDKNGEEDLISFDDLDQKQSNKPNKHEHVVVAKHVGSFPTSQTDSNLRTQSPGSSRSYPHRPKSTQY